MAEVLDFAATKQPVTRVPEYLAKTYWWAYVHPNAVRLFERQWLVNAILWGNFARLRDTALAALGGTLPGRTLQVACVYGDFTAHLLKRVGEGGLLDVVDVLPIQLDNLRRKLDKSATVRMLQRNSADLGLPDASYERAVLFFLLHEQPDDVRRKTFAEALRVVKPGGRLVILDYHRPSRWHPLNPLMQLILRTLEPFAMDLWAEDIAAWLPADVAIKGITKTTMWGGMYQLVVIER